MEHLRLLRKTLVGTALAACGLMQAHAQFLVGEQAAVIQSVTTSVYLNGGVGADEQATMRRVATEFPLRITFSEGKDGQFLADIPLVIQDASGNAIFALRKAGPMLFLVLPPGRYKVSAGFNGVTQTQQVSVEGKGSKDLQFRWAGIPKGQVWTAARD